jgi:hypothetical protein
LFQLLLVRVKFCNESQQAGVDDKFALWPVAVDTNQKYVKSVDSSLSTSLALNGWFEI